MFAVIKAAGKQYVAVPGQKIKFDKTFAEEGEKVTFDEVLLVADGDDVAVGTPVLKDAQVKGTVVREGRDRKIIVFKYKAKKRHRKKHGHRQPFSEVKIEDIVFNKKPSSAKASATSRKATDGTAEGQGKKQETKKKETKPKAKSAKGGSATGRKTSTKTRK